VVVDMQNAFIDPVHGSGVEGADAVVAAVNRRVAQAHEQGWPVFLTRDVDPFGRAADAEHDTALHVGIDARGTVVAKGPGARAGFSGFVLSPGEGRPGEGGLSALGGLLRQAEVTRVHVVGLAADVCVSATACDARRLGYDVTVDLEATAFVHAHPDGDEAALQLLRQAGVRLAGEVR